MKLSFRLDEELADRLRADANSRGETVSAAASRLISCALGMSDERPTASDTTSGGTVEALTDYVATLKRQLEIKDAQISSLSEQQAELTRVAEKLGKVADQAQQLHALATTPKGELIAGGVDGDVEEKKPSRGWFSRIFG